MNELHRRDTPERKHYTVDRKSLVDIKPTILYSGSLSKSQDFHDSQHSHYFLEILYVVDGKGIVEIDGRTYNIAKNDIVIYNADVKHSEQSSTEEPLEINFIAFDKIQLKNLPPNFILSPNTNCIFNAAPFADVLSNLFKIICHELTEKDEFYTEIVKHASYTLIMYVFRVMNRTVSNIPLLNKDNILNIVLPYIDKNFLDNISLSDIAAKCFVNKYYLSHLFTENFGMSVGQYVRSKKLELAQKQICETNLPISDIAGQCGFSDPAYFNRLFKKATGLTPLQYRKSLNQEQDIYYKSKNKVPGI